MVHALDSIILPQRSLGCSTWSSQGVMSAVLPTLPSIRAKELERASANSNDKDDGNVEHIISDESTSSQTQEEKSKQSVPIPSATILSNNNISSSTIQNESERLEQLAMLYQKEKKCFGGLPPLESSIACNSIHQYISTTCSFLNSFIADVNASHEGIDHKLTVLERQMSMLESKLASVPDLFPDDNESDHGDSSAGDVDVDVDDTKEPDHQLNESKAEK